jgi:hypothetical protein
MSYFYPRLLICFFHSLSQLFREDGTFIKAFGSQGNGQGQFDSPRSVLIYKDEIYITDGANARVQVTVFALV